MVLCYFTTMADPRRPGLTFRLEFENEEVFEAWVTIRWFQQNLNDVWMDTLKPNTSLTIFHESGRIEHKAYGLRWDQCLMILEAANDLDGPTKEKVGSGRRPARVLVTTTSKERREGKMKVSF